MSDSISIQTVCIPAYCRNRHMEKLRIIMRGETAGSMKLLYIAVYLWTEYNILTFPVHRLIIRKILAPPSGMDKMCSQAYSAGRRHENSREPAGKKA